MKRAMREHDGAEKNGRWDAQVDKRSRCGGCFNHRETFLHNPQVKLKRRFEHKRRRPELQSDLFFLDSLCLQWEAKRRRC